MFKDKGDTYDGRRVTCGACGSTSTGSSPLDTHICTCGRVLNGVGRHLEPDLS